MRTNSQTPLAALLLVWLLAVQPASAQTINDLGQWNALFAQGDLSEWSGHPSDRLKWWFDGHYRLFDDSGGFGQSIVRPGVGIDVGKDSALWVGYAWIRTSPISGSDIDEHRCWQQWTWSRSVEPYKFALRSRLEQRFVESADDTGLRFRQFVRGQKSLGPCSPLTFVVWDELFIDLNDTDWGQRSGFDQNRIFVGFGMKKHRASNWRVEVGYLNQVLNLSGPVDRSNHILAVNLFRSPR